MFPQFLSYPHPRLAAFLTYFLRTPSFYERLDQLRRIGREVLHPFISPTQAKTFAILPLSSSCDRFTFFTYIEAAAGFAIIPIGRRKGSDDSQRIIVLIEQQPAF